MRELPLAGNKVFGGRFRIGETFKLYDERIYLWFSEMNIQPEQLRVLNSSRFDILGFVVFKSMILCC